MFQGFPNPQQGTILRGRHGVSVQTPISTALQPLPTPIIGQAQGGLSLTALSPCLDGRFLYCCLRTGGDPATLYRYNLAHRVPLRYRYDGMQALASGFSEFCINRLAISPFYPERVSQYLATVPTRLPVTTMVGMNLRLYRWLPNGTVSSLTATSPLHQTISTVGNQSNNRIIFHPFTPHVVALLERRVLVWLIQPDHTLLEVGNFTISGTANHQILFGRLIALPSGVIRIFACFQTGVSAFPLRMYELTVGATPSLALIRTPLTPTTAQFASLSDDGTLCIYFDGTNLQLVVFAAAGTIFPLSPGGWGAPEIAISLPRVRPNRHLFLIGTRTIAVAGFSLALVESDNNGANPVLTQVAFPHQVFDMQLLPDRQHVALATNNGLHILSIAGITEQLQIDYRVTKWETTPPQNLNALYPTGKNVTINVRAPVGR